MLKQYKPRTLKTWVLAANEHLVFKFEKDAEEEKTRDPNPLALRPTRFVCLLLKPPGTAKRGPKHTVHDLFSVIGDRVRLYSPGI
jgi:hypothetical protein